MYVNRRVIFYPHEAVLEAARRFPTPFFLYSEARLRENCRNFRKAFSTYFPDFKPLFAVKANANPDLLRIVQDEGFGFDCSSTAELFLAHLFDVEGMYTGNYVRREEFEYAIQNTRLILNLDDISALETVRDIGMPEALSLRINPGAHQSTSKLLVKQWSMSGVDAKYGIPFERASDAYSLAQSMGVKHFGIHMMTGSNVLDEDYFYFTTKKLLTIVAEIKQNTGVVIEFLNIGGGFGVPYRPCEHSINLNAVARNVHKAFKEVCARYELQPPRLYAEPGRYISADTGWLVGRVTSTKEGYKKFVGIDASSNDMPRPSIYDAYHHISIMNNARTRERVSVVGSICENNDQFARDRLLPSCASGDIVVIHNCGGHAYAMGHNYNNKLRHAEYLIRDSGKIDEIRKAETIEDLFRGTNLTGY
ncbi:MAG: Diaminopimelate decarboxylase [Candidatus Magasanikbacteria bacterium GW2011_GWA2_45_39]|uniref:Diaminopimelate decarboxylase n=2 Tax=Candidatus Magasanikiibacteriota TaxID=1752731 RepID=A0A0G1MYK5_9BACT|nr:MAG: Diaminopimelate decarboxylase [Candidatus Magasanikbacteria bacterium GW2011_GWA2_45_39]KKU13162.1 MAG: Diaminopimelate decarboxylase [Candidatus Magasanikbacteria bacterium GW2011_GWC2_45_8]HBW74221.1 diaminopimelate decarboxylase [Candidatus Magasanikbacteria bacterium]